MFEKLLLCLSLAEGVLSLWLSWPAAAPPQHPRWLCGPAHQEVMPTHVFSQYALSWRVPIKAPLLQKSAHICFVHPLSLCGEPEIWTVQLEVKLLLSVPPCLADARSYPSGPPPLGAQLITQHRAVAPVLPAITIKQATCHSNAIG